MKITCQINANSLRIYVNGLLHVAVKRSSLVGVQSWKERDGEWWIEYRFTSQQSLKSMYDTEDKWKQILALLNEDWLFTTE